MRKEISKTAVDRFIVFGYHGLNFSLRGRKGDVLKKIYLLIIGFIFLSGCGGFSIRAKEPSPPPTLPHQLQAPLTSLPDRFEIAHLESPARLLEPTVPAEDSSSKNPSFEGVNKDSWEEYTLLLSAKEKEPIQNQDQAADPLFNPPPIVKEENPSPPAEKKNPRPKAKPSKVVSKAPKTEEHREAAADNVNDEGEGEDNEREAAHRLQEIFDQMPDEDLSRLFTSGETESITAGKSKDQDSYIFATFPSLLNDKVKEFINFFQNRADGFFSRSLARSQAYEEMMKKIFREKNLPEELFYLALIESGYNPNAFSRAKASGIWQFVAQTARRFGLKVDKWVDERRDPEKSTYAAAEYLKSLYQMFNCWDLAAASFNAGEGKVLKAMKKAQSQDFWKISQHRYLKRETKKYVPMFLAAVLIAREPRKYGFANLEYHPPLVYEKVTVPPATSLALIAKAAEVDLSEIRTLNPALKRGKTPPHDPQFEIKLPLGKKEIFEKNFLTLRQATLSGAKKHRVRSGETLGRIAKRYGLDLQTLCQFNDLSPQARIKPGTILLLPP